MTVLVLGLDRCLCMVEIALIRNEEDAGEKIIRIGSIQLLKVVLE